MSSVVRRLPSRASLLSLSEAAASPVMSSHALFEAFVSDRTTPVTTTGSTSGGATGGSFRVTPPPCSPLLRQTPPPNRPGQHSQHHSAFATAYFGTRSTAEAFAEYHAHRAADASVRLRSVEVAAMRRAARLRQVRTRQHAAESHRQYVARRAMQRLQEAQKKIEDRLALAEERRSTVIEQRVEAQRRAEARRAAVRDRLQLLKRAGEVVRSSDCRVACEAIAPLTRLVDATLEEARRNGDADAYINGPAGAPMPLPDSLHGRFVFHSALEKVEAILVADARQVLPGAVSDLLDILLTAADAAASDSPQGSPEKRRSAQHVDPTIAPSAEPKWAQLHDPEYRLKAAMLVIVAHHGAIEAVAPARSDAAWEASKAAFDVVDRLSYIVKCSLAVPTQVETATSVVDTASRVQVRELLDAVVHHVEVVAATKALRQAQMLTELTQALVQLRLGEAARQRDIARTTQRAVAAGAGSPEARRERQVAPRRSVLTSAVASQIEKVLRRLHAVGGADAVRAAEHAALAALAQYEMDVAASSAATTAATTAAAATPI